MRTDFQQLSFMFTRTFLFCALLSFGFVAGCSKPPSNSGSATPAPRTPALKIGISFQELDNPYFAVMKQAFDEACRSVGAESFVTDARHDVTK